MLNKMPLKKGPCGAQNCICLHNSFTDCLRSKLSEWDKELSAQSLETSSTYNERKYLYELKVLNL